MNSTPGSSSTPSPQEQAFQAWQIAHSEYRQKQDAAAHWDAEYQFWHKIITEEVERFRFNGGYEPLTVDLYPTGASKGAAFLGETQVGHAKFRVTAHWALDQNDVKILRVQIRKA